MLNEFYGEINETFDEAMRKLVYGADERGDKASLSEGMTDYHPDGYMESLLESGCPDSEPDRCHCDRPVTESEAAEPDKSEAYDGDHAETYEEPHSASDGKSYDEYYGKAYREIYADSDDDVEELDTLTADELMHLYFPKKEFIVSTLLTPGLAVLAGAPKIGKSWMVLDMCLKIAKGEAFLGQPTRKGSVLYLALEDDRYRLHRRLLRIADEGSDNMRVAHRCSMEPEALERQIQRFIGQHPDTRLIVIDTFQKIRRSVREMSYANDYAEVSRLKSIADKEGVCILLVHHTRKLGDSDYMNEISGTNGIAGSADTLMVLKKDKRSSREATLSCTGRDIEDRELTLSLDRDTCVWQVKSDSLTQPDEDIPDEIPELIEFMKEIKSYSGTNTDFTDMFSFKRQFIINPNQLKKSMNLYRDELLRHGVEFVSLKSHGRRSLAISYFADKDEYLGDDGVTVEL